MDNQSPKFSLKKRALSFKFAFNGIYTLAKSQHNFWIHLVAMAGVLICGYFLGLSRNEWLFVFFAIGLVLSAEGVNTAIEYLVDLVSPEYNEIAGKVKDIAAGAVLISAITAAVIGLVIFLPKIYKLFI